MVHRLGLLFLLAHAGACVAICSLMACGVDDDSGAVSGNDAAEDTHSDTTDALGGVDQSDSFPDLDADFFDTEASTDTADPWRDLDLDGVPDRYDNCPTTYNLAQTDTDSDGVGDECDSCPRAFSPDQADSDGDGIGDACEIEACESNIFCGAGTSVCCAVGEECIEDVCVPICADGVRCEGLCCSEGEVCLTGACTGIGADCIDDGDCNFNEFCDGLLGRCLPFPEVQACVRPGDFDVFSPTSDWTWTGVEFEGRTYANVLSIPVVGDVDADGTPEVVVTAYSSEQESDRLRYGIIVGISGDTGATEYVNGGYDVLAARHLALANVDDDPGLEIAVSLNGQLAMLDDFATCSAPTAENDYCYIWRIDAPELESANAGSALAIHDMDGDGDPHR